MITVCAFLMLYAEHSMAFAMYESMEEKWSREYVRRFRIQLRVFAVLAVAIVWALTLSKDLNLIADQLFWLVVLVNVILGSWTMLGARKKD